MKKQLAVCLMILVAFNLFIPLAHVEASPTTYEDNFYNTIESSLAIVPDININEVGTLKVTISWVTPSLTFEKTTRDTPSPSVSYYALKANKDVVFTIVNESVESTNDDFNGNIKVTPNYSWPTSSQAGNVSISLTKENTPVLISYGVTNKEIKLVYAANPLFFSGALSLSLTPAQITSIMTANVTFVIEQQ